MSACPTVKIVHPTKGFCTINESDFDPKKHTLSGPTYVPAAKARTRPVHSRKYGRKKKTD